MRTWIVMPTSKVKLSELLDKLSMFPSTCTLEFTYKETDDPRFEGDQIMIGVTHP